MTAEEIKAAMKIQGNTLYEALGLLLSFDERTRNSPGSHMLGRGAVVTQVADSVRRVLEKELAELPSGELKAHTKAEVKTAVIRKAAEYTAMAMICAYEIAVVYREGIPIIDDDREA